MNQDLIDKLVPDTGIKYADLSVIFPKRNLPEGAIVTRFAPSPTGFIHIGGILVAYLARKMARQTQGIFILRIEDTDKNREIQDGVIQIASALNEFGIDFDEGPSGEFMDQSKGNYGPYLQSERLKYYHSVARELLIEDKVYPCFVTSEELDAMRQEQEAQKLPPGYYGIWAKHRNLSEEQIEEYLDKNIPYVLRFKNTGDINKKITFNDQIRGSLTMPENVQDTILIKSDEYPTYHFAHIVDDWLMRTTHVFRADEWLPSTPLHIQLFQAINQNPPLYCHVAPITKLDNGNKRKLSKRKDPEAGVAYYIEAGYPKEAVLEYIVNLINASFEDWRKQNPLLSIDEFVIKLNKTNVSGPLLDMVKLDDISKEVISRMNSQGIIQEMFTWVVKYDSELFNILDDSNQIIYLENIFNIERTGPKVRKDISKWSEVKDLIRYFFDNWYEEEKSGIDIKSILPQNIDLNLAKDIMQKYLDQYQPVENREIWFENLQKIALQFNFATSPKEYKNNPDQYSGHVGDLAMLLRIILTNRKNTPDLYEAMTTMGEQRVKSRISAFINI